MGYCQKKTKIKLRWALFVTYTIIQSIISSEMCSLHLTHPSAHTLGAVGGWHSGTRGAVGSWALLKGLTSVMDNSCRSRDSNPQPRVTSPTLYPLGHDCPKRKMRHQSQQCRWPEGHYQRNLGFHYTWAVTQTDFLHATPHWCSNSCKRRPN